MNKTDKDFKNDSIMNQIIEIYYNHKKRYGYRRIALELGNRGYRINHKKVKRVQSMSRKGNCFDNSPIENFFGKMKNEMFYGNEYKYQSLKELRTAMEEYIEYLIHRELQLN